MKLSNRYQYYVLCEDAQTRSFINSVLTEQGINARKVRFNNIPCGEGCGEAAVRRGISKEVKRLRATRYISSTLIVCTDADNHKVDERISILVNEVEKEIGKWDRLKEPIIMWIPKLQIETWIHFLDEEAVDEEMRFPHSGKPVSCKKQARLFSEYCQDLKELDCTKIGSIAEAKKEYKRVCELQSS